MYQGLHITAVIPALNEATNIATVVTNLLTLREKHTTQLVDEVIVCDNGSTDDTAAIAYKAGAKVVSEAHKGYGAACLKALAAINKTDVVVFLNGDGAEDTNELIQLLKSLISTNADLVIGSRTLCERQNGAMSPHQQFGNHLASALIRLIWHHQTTDLGPYRAIRYDQLLKLDMADLDFGWTIEMQIKAIRRGMAVVEIPVRSLKTHHKSKISGTLLGTIGAGYKILSYVFYFALLDLVAKFPGQKTPFSNS